MRKVFLRADADAHIGYGHFIRTLALADMLKNDFECTFFTKSPTPYQVSECSKVCRLVRMESDGDFLKLLSGGEIVVLDNYYFSTEFQIAVKAKGCPLVCLDGMTSKHYAADVLVCQSLGMQRENFSLEPYTQLCAGLSYALLRKPFIEASGVERIHREKCRNIAVSFGGADKFNLTGAILKRLSDLEGIESITAITGDGYKAEELKSPAIKYRRNISAEEITDIFLACDLAILPASSILKEALACRLQCISGYFVDNQVKAYNSYLDEGLICGIGDFTSPDAVDAVLDAVITGKYKSAHPEYCGVDKEIPSRYIKLFQSL